MFRSDLVLFALGFALVSRRELFIRQRDADQYSSVDAYALAEIAVVGISVLVILFNPRILGLAKQVTRCSLRWLVAFLGVGVVTAPFSANLFYSTFFAGEYLSQVVLVFAIVAGSRNQQDLVKRMLLCCLIVTILSVSFSFSRAGFSGDLFAYKTNSGAAAACMAAVFSFSLLWSGSTFGNRRLTMTTVFVSLLGVAMTTSAASIISTFFGFGVAALVLGKGRAPMLFMLVGIAVVFVLNPELAFNVLFPGKDVQEVATLHGRASFWDDAIQLAQESPLIGYGYAMAAKVGGLTGTNLHNSAFSVLLGTGLLGLILFSIGACQLFGESTQMIKRRVPIVGPAFAAFSAGLLNSNSISFFGEDWRGPSFLFVLMWAAIGFIAIKTKESQPSPVVHG